MYNLVGSSNIDLLEYIIISAIDGRSYKFDLGIETLKLIKFPYQ